MTIWKYELPVMGLYTLSMPDGARPLSVQPQYGHPCLWALVDSTKPHSIYQFCMVGTGYEFDPDGWDYIGTCVTHGGDIVWHVFWRPQ